MKSYADIVWGDVMGFGSNWRNRSISFTNNAALNNQWATLEGNSSYIDTTLEGALSGYYIYSAERLNAAAEAILSHSNPRAADRQLATHVYIGLISSQFMNDNAAVGRYDTMLKFITDRGNVTRAEVEAYYRNGIRSLISEVVDEEFNRISFMIDRSYNAVLSRNPQNGHYNLSYEGVGNVVNELSASSLDNLLQNIQANKIFPEQSRILGSPDVETSSYLRAQAELIPAVVYANWKPNNMDAMQLIKSVITDFYLNGLYPS